jgi:membrane fusion protein, multidrug efflux system
LGALATAKAQQGQAGPPAVGVFEAVKRPMTETNEYLGRIKSFYRVAVTARVTAFLDKWNFVEGSEVKAGDLLYQLERGPFEADLKSKQAQVAQLEATLGNAKLTTERARILLSGPAGQQSTYDAALANQESLEAQVQAAQAQVDLSKINLDYTEIHSPIDGRIGLTAITEGNVVAPGYLGARHHRHLPADRRPGLQAARRLSAVCRRGQAIRAASVSSSPGPRTRSS